MVALVVATLLLFVLFNREAMLRATGRLDTAKLNYREYGVPLQFYSEGDPIGGLGFLPLNFFLDLGLFFVPLGVFAFVRHSHKAPDSVAEGGKPPIPFP